jgi:glycosyltransferase involved in cell wall biosynthesis
LQDVDNPPSSELPLITIGMTCFNAEDTILRALKSALAQTWPRFEIVVVDDASTDRSVEILEAAAARDPRIELVRHKDNKGISTGLNAIVNHARGEFIAFFDDDDESYPDRLRLQWERLTSYERAKGTDLVFCYSDRRQIERRGGLNTERVVTSIGREPPEPSGEIVADFILCLIQPRPYVWGGVGTCALMTRKSTLERVGPFDEALRRAEDWDIVIRLSRLGGHFISVNQQLLTYHLTTGPDKSARTSLIYGLALRRKYREYLSERGLYRAAIAVTYARHYYYRGARWKAFVYLLLAALAAPRAMLPYIVAVAKRRIAATPIKIRAQKRCA